MTGCESLVCQTTADGRVAVLLQQQWVLLPRGCTVRPMPAWLRWWVGPLVPGCTWTSGIRLQASLLPVLTPVMLCHEAIHWWQATRRMGPVSYTATYAWHLLLNLVRRGPGHWHDTHAMEVEARRAAAIMADPVLPSIDVEAWLTQHLPATR